MAGAGGCIKNLFQEKHMSAKCMVCMREHWEECLPKHARCDGVDVPWLKQCVDQKSNHFGNSSKVCVSAVVAAGDLTDECKGCVSDEGDEWRKECMPVMSWVHNDDKKDLKIDQQKQSEDTDNETTNTILYVFLALAIVVVMVFATCWGRSFLRERRARKLAEMSDTARNSGGRVGELAL